MSSSQPRRRTGDDYSSSHPPPPPPPRHRLPHGQAATPPPNPAASAHHVSAPLDPHDLPPSDARARVPVMTISPRGSRPSLPPPLRVDSPYGVPHRYEPLAGPSYPSGRLPPDDPREFGRVYERHAPIEPGDREDPRRLPFRYPEYERDYPPPEVLSREPATMYPGPSRAHGAGTPVPSASTAVAAAPHEPALHPYGPSQGPGLSSRRVSVGDTSAMFAHHPPPLSRSPLPPAAIRDRPERDDIPAHSPPVRTQSTQPRSYFTPSPRYSVEGLSRTQVDLYNRGWHDAMEAVQQGVVWIDGVAHSQVPMWIPESERQSYPPLVPRRDERERLEREYIDPEWRERGAARDQAWRWEAREGYGPGPSRSHSAPDPRTGPPYQDYHAATGGPHPHYGPAAPPLHPQPPHYAAPYGGSMAGGPMRRPHPGYTMPPEHYGLVAPGYPPYGAHTGMRPHLQPPQIRTRQQISCHPCRNRKVKCSGTKPCDACVKIKRESECQYEKTVRRRGKGKKGMTHESSDHGDSREGDRSDDIKKDYAKSGTSDANSDAETGASGDMRRSSMSRSRSASPEPKPRSGTSSRADRERQRPRELNVTPQRSHSDRRVSDAASTRERSRSRSPRRRPAAPAWSPPAAANKRPESPE